MKPPDVSGILHLWTFEILLQYPKIQIRAKYLKKYALKQYLNLISFSQYFYFAMIGQDQHFYICYNISFWYTSSCSNKTDPFVISQADRNTLMLNSIMKIAQNAILMRKSCYGQWLKPMHSVLASGGRIKYLHLSQNVFELF